MLFLNETYVMKKSLPIKLYAGLGLAIAIVILCSIFILFALQKQVDQSSQVNKDISLMQNLRDVRYSVSQMRASRRIYWFTKNESVLTTYNEGLVIIPNRLYDLKNGIVSNQELTENLAILNKEILTLFAFWGNRGKITAELSKERLTEITIEEEKILSNIFKQFDTLKAIYNKELVSNENQLLTSNIQTKRIVIVGISLLMIVVIILVNAVVVTLKSRIKAGLKLQNSLTEMEKANFEAAENNWVLQGVHIINNGIQSATGTNNLSSDIINSVVNYLELPAGAIYLYEEEHKLLKMTASVAVSSSVISCFEIGEGIVGNAALKNKLSIIKEIPNDYWKIQTALGETSGKGQIVCMPLWIGDNLKAVIELGNLNEFSNKQLRLLETVSNSLATSINARQSRLKITSLLERVQEQQEEMIQQHEELRQTNEELSRQAEALIASEEELKTQEEELRQMNSELLERNNIIDNSQEALLLKAKELEATSKYKSEFLANMSHELRTPLNSVLILAKLLSDNNSNNLNPKQIEYANIIHKSGTDLLNLINDILDLSKIEAGKIDLVIEDISIESILHDLQQLFSVVAAEKGIIFAIKKANNIPSTIKTDKQRIEQILKNLLSNAFKFTPKDGTVSIVIENRDQFNRKRIGISVSDSGIGISPEKQQLIFNAFQQADGSTSRQYGGTGLGLSISKELIRLLGGEIELKSEIGKGSCFTILLPLEILIEEKIEEILLPGLDNTSLENVVRQELIKDDRNQLNIKDRLMLIIEDDVNFATILIDFAHIKGFKVIVALKGDEGLAYAYQYHPDAIILDMQLPVIDGWSILKRIKADKDLKNIPVHIISAFDDNQLHTSGALAYIKKPIDREGLEKAFENISSYLNENIKKVLIISESHFKDDLLQQLILEKHHDISFKQYKTIGSARISMQSDSYDCIIADIGSNVTEGINNLQILQDDIRKNPIPVIVYLDADISASDETQLKKISSAIVRESPAVLNRLKDEIDLFLFKVSEINETPNSETLNQSFDINDATLVGKRVLLVDDDMRNVFALTNVLEIQKMIVTPASDGQESLDLLATMPAFDLVLMDIMMPEMDGYEAIKRIREDLKMTKLPIIALTAKAMSGDKEKCLAVGASDYITKPVDIHKLLSLLRVWISK